MSSNGARYGNMASPPTVRISPGRPSGPTDLFLQIAGSRFLIILMSMVTRGSCFYLCDVSLAAECRNIIGIKGVGLTIESVISLPLQSLIAGMCPQFPLRRVTSFGRFNPLL
jgi:hypothetical protein